jgi:lipopolysaccharide export LptBFGC system permease protein LptF
MQRFDRYVLRVFLAWWVVIALALLGLFTALQLLGKSDEIQQADQYGLGAGDLARYALLSQPFLLLTFGPYVTLLAALGAVMQLLKHREWVPVMTAGRSALRAVAPMLLAAFALALALAWVRESAAPRLMPAHEALERRFFSHVVWAPRDLWGRGADDVRMHVESFTPAVSGGPALEDLQVFLRGPRGEEMLRAASARWDGVEWLLEEGRLAHPGGEEPVARFMRAGLAAEDFERAWFARVRPLDLAVADCAALLAGDPDHRQAATLAWSWRCAPLVPVLLILLGLPFVMRFERRTSWEGIAGGLALCGAYFVVELVARDLGGRGALSPFWAGAGPVLLLAGCALAATGRLRG